MTSPRPYHVLFLCTGNSARSILAESLLNELGRGRFVAHSAGSHPTGSLNPLALELLERFRMPTAGLRSKSWDEFAAPDAPVMDFVFTVCDEAAGELCPAWPGQPITAHWGVPDPAHAPDPDAERKAVFQAYSRLANRIQILLSLPLAKLDRLAITREVTAIGQQ